MPGLQKNKQNSRFKLTFTWQIPRMPPFAKNPLATHLH
ncbi:hypothetical protein CSB66_3245 [Enterobacter hormaechei]|nr:hypothetical protein T636_A0795 [Enterobacter hormaechei subsp. xiangfangensis]RCG82407.1 hypothetical protein CSB66_3245 [Enterobacter hormaechei]